MTINELFQCNSYVINNYFYCHGTIFLTLPITYVDNFIRYISIPSTSGGVRPFFLSFLSDPLLPEGITSPVWIPCPCEGVTLPVGVPCSWRSIRSPVQTRSPVPSPSVTILVRPKFRKDCVRRIGSSTSGRSLVGRIPCFPPNHAFFSHDVTLKFPRKRGFREGKPSTTILRKMVPYFRKGKVLLSSLLVCNQFHYVRVVFEFLGSFYRPTY